MRVAAWAHARGVPMSAYLIPAYVDAAVTSPVGRQCLGDGRHLYLTWKDAAVLRDRCG